MSYPTTTGNGGSLEDCHTNLFALTDLDGIKWRKLTSSVNHNSLDPLEDPVLQSFTKCIQSDILCVWRKVQLRTTVDTLALNQLSVQKELWIFWYGKEPDFLGSLLSKELNAIEEGSWDHGLPYECRTLLFKALHNLIERCLLTKNFVRLGKWFVQPHSYRTAGSHGSTHLSFRFSFFLHGESQVCASIDVRQHPPLKRLHQHHLNVASHGNSQGIQVILAPFGLAGVLTGHSYKDTDPTTQKILEDWRHFYQIDERHHQYGGVEHTKMPAAVEVNVGGARMRYPTNMVLLTVEGDAEITRFQQDHIASGLGVDSTPSPCPGAVPGDLGDGYMAGAKDGSRTLPQGDTILGQKIVEKVWQDCCVVSGSQLHRHQVNQNAEAEESGFLGNWEFGEPMQKNQCACSKPKSKRNGGSGKSSLITNKHGKVEKSDKVHNRISKKDNPFHRRNPFIDNMIQQDIDTELVIQRVPNPSIGFKSQQGNTSGSVIPPLKNFTDHAADSPNSGAPSPLVASQILPSVNQNGDPTMPTLSPHPPTKHLDKDLNSSMNSNASAASQPGQSQQGQQMESHEHLNNSMNSSTTTTGAAVLSAGVCGRAQGLVTPKSEYNGPHNSHNHPTQQQHDQTHQFGVNHVQEHNKTEGTNIWLHTQKHLDYHSIKRPRLPSNGFDGEDEENTPRSLYDYKSLNAWLEHPVKRLRKESRPDGLSRSDPSPSSSVNGGYHLGGKPWDGPPTPQQPEDPYAFPDDNDTPSSGTTLPKRSLRASRDESFSRYNKQDEDSRRSSDSFTFKDEKLELSPGATRGGVATTNGPTGASSTALIHEKDLKITPMMPDQLFDTDESGDSDADLAHELTPPSSNKPAEERGMMGKPVNMIKSVPNGPNPDDHMYPTPPSCDGQTNACSPSTQTEAVHEMPNMEYSVHKTEPAFLPIVGFKKDWSFVYKPPTMAMIVGSTEYCPIELPSARLSPIPIKQNMAYKPSWQYPQCQLPVMEKQQHQQPHGHFMSMGPGENSGNQGNVSRIPQPERMTSVEASPAPFTQSSSQQRTPLSYELQSPASNASSYMNRGLNSVDPQGTNSQLPEVNSLVVNLVLMDSIFNLFKDHNFDSCNICVCNMSIKGADVGLYLPAKDSEAEYKCNCGFSAVTNRKYGFNSGLFYEDEVDITGVRNNRLEKRKTSLLSQDIDSKDSDGTKNLGDGISQDVLVLLQGQFSCLFPSSTVLFNHYRKKPALAFPGQQDTGMNILEIQDGCEVCFAALEAGRQSMENCPSQKLDEDHKRSCLHKWPYLQNGAKIPENSQEVVRILKSLQPYLQEALQRKKSWETVYKITGPLSWKDFHILAGRGPESLSEPQPIPRFLVGYEKDHLLLAPHAVRYWDKLLLEPYGRPRDIAYLVVAPDNDYVLGNLKDFFKELTIVYELCRFGRHVPLTNVLRDGIMRVGKKSAAKVASNPNNKIDKWFKLIGNTQVASKLRSYALIMRHQLAPFLATQSLDRNTIFDSRDKEKDKGYKNQATPSPAPPHTPENPATPQGNIPAEEKAEEDEEKEDKKNKGDTDQEDKADIPTVVIYVIDPFTYGQEWDDLNRLAMLGLLRCYHEMLSALPESWQSHVQLQMVPLQSVLDFRDSSMSQTMKTLALSVYTQSRRHLNYQIIGRSLTGFGPASAAELILKSGSIGVTKFYSPPFILAPEKNKIIELSGEKPERATVLMCGYCLSEDQRWLLAVCTDNSGEILETCTINIEIPNRNRRKKASARKIGLSRLWDFILGIMSTAAIPWRLVIGRLGRLGHGELRGWSGILGKKNLARASRQLQEMCRICGLSGSSEMPCILSACLISMESHNTMHVMDDLKPEERKASERPLETPRDLSATHILVFPTSATAATQKNYSGNQDADPLDDQLGSGLGDDIMIGLDEDELDVDGIGGIGGIGADLFGLTSPGGSPQHNPSDDPHGAGGSHSPTMNGQSKGGMSMVDPQDEENINLLQQPLAMGFYVSNAPTGPMPPWVWSGCPHRKGISPACFRAALHIHYPNVQQISDEFCQTRKRNAHMLDSQLTCDVLRYVLETYNALSWLNMDPVTSDRRSCLPIHFVILMQLYQAMDAFV